MKSPRNFLSIDIHIENLENSKKFLKEGRLIQTLSGHKSWIYSIFVDEGIVYSGSFDKTVLIWEVECYEVTFIIPLIVTLP